MQYVYFPEKMKDGLAQKNLGMSIQTYFKII